MLKKVIAVAALLVMVSAVSAMAQSRAQVTVFGGYTFSDGVTGDPVKALDGKTYDTVDVKNGANWGVAFGVFATQNIEVGFLFSQQFSKLDIAGATTRELGDLTINTYHPYVAFNLGDGEAKVRPYFLVGLGATNYGSVDYTAANGQPGSTSSKTQFSTTWGAGVKLYPAPKLGLHVGIQWTPTYIKSDAAGWWCDPYWGCYVVSNSQYSNQFQFNGGVTFRF
jgi:hypothetical protein